MSYRDEFIAKCPFKTGDAVVVGPDSGGFRPRPLAATVVEVEPRKMRVSYDAEVLGGGPWDGWLVRLRFPDGTAPQAGPKTRGMRKDECWFGWEWLTRAQSSESSTSIHMLETASAPSSPPPPELL